MQDRSTPCFSEQNPNKLAHSPQLLQAREKICNLLQASATKQRFLSLPASRGVSISSFVTTVCILAPSLCMYAYVCKNKTKPNKWLSHCWHSCLPPPTSHSPPSLTLSPPSYPIFTVQAPWTQRTVRLTRVSRGTAAEPENSLYRVRSYGSKTCCAKHTHTQTQAETDTYTRAHKPKTHRQAHVLCIQRGVSNLNFCLLIQKMHSNHHRVQDFVHRPKKHINKLRQNVGCLNV